jgi:hypothetical protein
VVRVVAGSSGFSPSPPVISDSQIPCAIDPGTNSFDVMLDVPEEWFDEESVFSADDDELESGCVGC